MYPPILESQRPSVMHGTPGPSGDGRLAIAMQLPRTFDISTIGHIQILIRRQLNLESWATRTNINISPDREVIYLPASAMSVTGQFAEVNILPAHLRGVLTAGDGADRSGQTFTIQVRFGSSDASNGGPGHANFGTGFAAWRNTQVANSAFGEWSNTQRVFVFGGNRNTIFPAPGVVNDIVASFSWRYAPVSDDPLMQARLSFSYATPDHQNGTFMRSQNLPFESTPGDASGVWGAAGEVSLDVARLTGIVCTLRLITVNNTIFTRIIGGPPGTPNTPPIGVDTNLFTTFFSLDGSGNVRPGPLLENHSVRIVPPVGEEVEDGVTIIEFNTTLPALRTLSLSGPTALITNATGVGNHRNQDFAIQGTTSGPVRIRHNFPPHMAVMLEGNAVRIRTVQWPPFDDSHRTYTFWVNREGVEVARQVSTGSYTTNPSGPPSDIPATWNPLPQNPGTPFLGRRFDFFRIDLVSLEIIRLSRARAPFITNAERQAQFVVRDHSVEMGAEYVYLGIRYTQDGLVEGTVGPVRLLGGGAPYSLLYQDWSPRHYPGRSRHMNFNGISFLTTKLNQLRLSGNVTVRNFNRVSTDQITQTIGGRFPFFARTSQANYRTMQVSALISIALDPTHTFLNLIYPPGRQGWWQGDLQMRTGYIDLDDQNRQYFQQLAVRNEHLFSEAELASNTRRMRDPRGRKSDEIVKTDTLPSAHGFDMNTPLPPGAWSNHTMSGNLLDPRLYPMTEGPHTGFNPTFRKDITPVQDSDRTSDIIYAERKFREQVMQWLTDGKPKLFRSETEGNMIVVLTAVTFSPLTNSRQVYTFSATLTEVAECNLRNMVLYDLVPSDFAGAFVEDPLFLQHPDVVPQKQFRFFDSGVLDTSWDGVNPSVPVFDETF